MNSRLNGSLTALALMGLVLGAGFARANDVYIAQAAAGVASGADCADALVYTYFNASSNWTSSTPTGTKMGPGTTVHLCGTFTAPAGASGYLSFQGSGSSSSPVTLHFETGAVLTAAYWGSNGAVYGNGLSYVTVDGGSNGMIQATANGSSLANQQDGKGLFLVSCNSCEVKNLSVSDIYVHSALSDGNGQNTYGIYAQYGNNVTIDGNTVHDVKWAIEYAFSGGTSSSNVSEFNNVVYNSDHGYVVGGGNTSAVLSGALVYNNVFHDPVNWDDTADANHHDGVHTWAVASGENINGLMIYNNYFYGDWGIHCSANIFVDVENGGTTSNYYIFNNVLSDSNAANDYCGDGFIGPMGSNPTIVNNTMISDSNTNISGIDSYATGMTAENNIVVSAGTGIYSPAGDTITISNYNDFFNLSSNAMNYNGTWYSSLSSWAKGTGFDSQSISSNPNLSSGEQLQAGSPAIGVGVNLTSLGIAALDLDKAGIARPSSGAWDMGAYAYQGAPAPPTALAATVH